MNQADYINLIQKQLSGEISEGEELMLKDWLVLNETNKSIAEELSYVWEHASFHELPEIPESDILKEFAMLEERIDEEEAVSETKVIPLFKRKWAVAAAVLALVGISSFAIFQSFDKQANWAEATTGEETKEILLADGSTVYLNANSSLKYPTSFEGGNRTVTLSGEGFFEIAKDASHPFIVETPYEEIKVLGTSFNVRALENEPNSEVTVATGKVQVVSSITESILLPNEKVIVDHSSGVMEFVEETHMNEIAWHTREINFEDTPLSEVEVELEQIYNVEIDIANRELASCPFTANFGKEESLSTVLETIKTVFGVSIEQNGTQYHLVGGVLCE